MAIEEVGIRLRSDGAVETATGIGLSAAATGRLGAAAAAATPQVRGLAVASGQYTQAMRQLPMQITDVVTSLASGMPVWMVAIQQGGQIRDSFGGAVPAFNALRAAIPPVVLGIGGAGAAVAALTLAYQQGRGEQDDYVRGLLLTGNQANTTAGSLAQLAQAQDQVNGTQREAAQVLNQLVLTGNVSRAQMALSLQAVIDLERSLGVEAKTTVAALSKLGEDPLRAAVALHKQYGFLNMSTYEQIRLLEQQGRTAEAAAVAQEAFANQAIQRSKDMEGQLGLLEKAWRGVKSGAGEAWDAMLGIGRQRTLQDELADLDKKLAEPVRRGGNTLQAEQRRQAMRERRDAIAESLRLEQMAADRQAEQARRVREKAEADAKAGKPKEPDPLGAIRTGREQTLNDFLRSEKGAYTQDTEKVLKEYNDQRREAAELATQWDIWDAEQQVKRRNDELEREREFWQDKRKIWDDSFGSLMDSASQEWARFAETGEFSIKRVLQAWLAAQAQMQINRWLSQASDAFFKWLGGTVEGAPTEGASGGDISGPGLKVPAGGGRSGILGRGTIVFSPTIQIDSRTDRAEVLQLVQRSMESSQAQLLDRMERGET